MMNPMYSALGLQGPQASSPFLPPSAGMGFPIQAPPLLAKSGPVPGSAKYFKNQFGPGTQVKLPGGFSSGMAAIRKAPPGTIAGL